MECQLRLNRDSVHYSHAHGDAPHSFHVMQSMYARSSLLKFSCLTFHASHLQCMQSKAVLSLCFLLWLEIG